MKELVFYHGNCPDGLGAFWVYKKKYPDCLGMEKPAGDCRYIEKMIKGRNIIFLDMCPNNVQTIIYLARIANKITIIDHHRSTAKLLEDRILPDNVVTEIRMDKCAAMLTWDVLFPNEKYPELLKYINDRDMWHNEIIDSDIFQYGMESMNLMTLEGYDKLSSWDFDKSELLERGRIHKMVIESLMEDIMKNATPCTFMDVLGSKWTVWLYNSPKACISDIGDRILNKPIFDEMPDIACCWRYDLASNSIYISCRSKKENVDLSSISSQFSKGGGHKKAAGFYLDGELRSRFFPL
jgi:oligoribonuclease NrnB/cAMP/cGMP phosphodiesterase (DHH superfamily)